MNRITGYVLLALFVAALTNVASAQSKVKPLKALLITGGCCHEYAKQKDILKKGIESRAMVEFSHVHTDDTTTKARFGIYENPEWSKGYDVIIHDECTSDVKEEKYV